MEEYDIYRDIRERTGGDVYIGVVGPVRAGKSTFITNFMKSTVLPKMENDRGKSAFATNCGRAPTEEPA